jgi:cation diffusion facilitator family transporter
MPTISATWWSWAWPSITPKATSPGESFITIKRRHEAASLAIITTVGLTGLKLGVGLLSGSVGVLSEAAHSFLDLISAAISYFTVREAVKPADEDHPFGHGKIETLSSLFESLLLFITAILIVIEAVDHVLHPHPIAYTGLAIGVTFFSMVASYFTYLHNRGAAQDTESIALHVNALHFLADVVASGGVLLGLILLKLTGWLLLDPLIALAVAVYILWVSYRQVKEAILELSDVQLPEGEIQTIRETLSGFRDRIIDFHDLRTRKSGSMRHIDYHMLVCGHMPVDGSHAVCDEMESKITSVYPNASVNIHVEPCGKARTECTGCPHYTGIKKDKRENES